MTETENNDHSGFGLTPEVLQKMQAAANGFGPLMEGLTGPQIALVIASVVSSWIAVHTESRAQADNVLEFVFDRTRDGLNDAEKNHMTAWKQATEGAH